ncbi:MAG TPA: dienelactone hydrolase family protein, partial [Anaerolineales bacterium]|nr:dienelactone hydrolase family protein [Anaerolineales bacterium]
TNGGTVQDSLGFWKTAAAEGWITAAPQSSQAMWRGAYVWDDRGYARDELQRHYTSLIQKYAIDPQRVILAGHSLGGETAMWLALNAELPVQGFIAFGPSGPLTEDPEKWHDLLYQSAGLGLRGYIIFGEEDESIPQENIRLLVDLLNETGTPTDLETVPHAGHDYDPAYDDCLLRALEFIFPQGGKG